jgi:HSP20 family protein
MQLVRFDPFKGLLDDDFGAPMHQRGLKIREDDKSIFVEAVVAGVPKGDVEIEIEDGVLTIKAEVKEESKTQQEYKSSSYQYYYTTALSGGQWDKAEADIVDGVVKIEIPKAEAARPRKITLKSK